MKPFKLFACLVTLQFTCGLTLQAAALQNFRQWTDTNGRTITARLVETPDAKTVKIQRQDGQFFNVALKVFSAEDQAYVMAFRAGKTTEAPAPETGAASTTPLTGATPAAWTLLNSGGRQPAWTYSETPLDEIIEGINRQLEAKGVKTAGGLPLQIRTEPSDLAGRVKITGGLPDMSVAAFVKEIARINDLAVKTDATGMVVLTDKTPPASQPAIASFFGVPLKTP